MTWLVLAILTAFFESLKDVKSKQSLQFFDEYWVTWGTQVIAALLLLPILLWQGGIPPIQPAFWTALLIGGTLNIFAFLLYVKAIKEADLSLTVPLVTLTPLFLLLTSPLIVGEKPSGMDAIGVLLIVCGSYILNLKANQGSWFAPLWQMLQNSGCRKMLLVAFLWSFTSTYDKVGVVNSSPFFWSIALFLYVAAGLTPMLIYRGWSRSSKPTNPESTRGNWFPYLPFLLTTGAFSAIAVGFQMVALTLTSVAQVIAIKRMSSLFSVAFGHFLFGETGLKERLSGALVMVLGVAIMTLF
jgi:drug/metabolite transporter (DMT)-like permease